MIKNITQLRSEATQQLEKFKNGEINHKQASAGARLIGVIIQSATAQIQYAQLRGEQPEIEFMK